MRRSPSTDRPPTCGHRTGTAWRAALLLTLAAVLAGCVTDSGRELDPPTGGLATDGVPTVLVDGVLEEAQQLGFGGFSLDSPVFPPGAPMPPVYTAPGGGISPPLRWGSVPVGAVELGLVFEDTTDDFTLWVVGGLDPALLGISEGRAPDGADVYLAGYPENAYFGPDAPPGETRTYRFTLYAFAQPFSMDLDTPSGEVVTAMRGQSFTRATYAVTMTGA